MEFKDIIGIGIGLLNCWILYILSKNQNRKDDVHKQVNFLLEIDKCIIADPLLWGIFDGHEISRLPNNNDVLVKGKRTAFLYYIINSFEVVQKTHSENNDREDWIFWSNYFKDLVHTSSELRALIKIITDDNANKVYSERYQNYLKNAVAGY